MAPVSLMNFTCNVFPSTSRIQDPNSFKEAYIALWFKLPPEILPAEPVVIYTAPSPASGPDVSFT